MNITIKFENKKAALHFAHWLCGQGEQDYRIWMECREQEEAGSISATEFVYHKNNEFVPDGEIKVVLGRFSE